MKVWWCEEHKSGFEGQNAECDIRRLVAHKGLPITQCRMVEMQLVPADARMVPNEAVDLILDTIMNRPLLHPVGGSYEPMAQDLAQAIFDALVSEAS